MRGIRIAGALAAISFAVMASGAGELGWLSLCGKCMSPAITASGGLGAANAWAEARITPQEAKDWCENWSPGDKTCVREQMASEDYAKAYKATADCTAGRINPIFGGTYTYAGVWDGGDIGQGRSKWRDSGGRIVGRDNASNGLAIAQQWEQLCPKGLVKAVNTAPVSPSARPQAAAVAGAIYSVGQTVEAKFMSDWIPARVVRLRPGPNGAVDYEVNLANGQRGVVPARMLRAAR
jgi:hypothetical protein